MPHLTRRALLAALPLSLAACASVGTRPGPFAVLLGRSLPPAGGYAAIYGPVNDAGRLIPAVNLAQIDPAFLRREVDYPTSEAPGTIVIDTPNRYLYLVEGGGLAMRYGIGVGREGFAWSGRAVIKRKAKWPSWHPPVEMQARDPKARKWARGMPGGLNNPLGARAHYLYQGGRDTLYRIHGTNEPWTIGKNVSSGCIRMINQDAIDLYNRVAPGTPVIVIERRDGWSFA